MDPVKRGFHAAELEPDQCMGCSDIEVKREVEGEKEAGLEPGVYRVF